ncbi:MAG TPA: FtsX-like permease family protein [Gemmatimonadaceae bacterium]|nr:FtsX-like permease family protein [Gemmatimonadaceae bacterium]
MRVRVLDVKLLRDLLGMRGQALAIAVVIVGGVTTYVAATSVADSLEGTLASYYRDYRYADGFASVRRAPEIVLDRLREIPGIAEIDTRVVAAVNLELPGFGEPVTGTIISIPDGRQPLLDRLFVREGRFPGRGEEDAVLLDAAFADAHGFHPGAEIGAVIKGRRRTLRVVGVAMSPSLLMHVQPGTLFPDPLHYGALWMNRPALAAAYDMQGAFNDLLFTLAPGATLEDVAQRVELVLGRYGGIQAHGRSEEASHALITQEFQQLRAIATILPAIFLGVAAFLLNIVVTRLVALQREQIAVLKAFGYRDLEVGLHYVKLVLIIALSGMVAGTLFGIWAGRALGGVYLQYYRFPYLDFVLHPRVVVVAALVTTVASVVGVVRSVGRAVRVPPAEAMRPAAPATFRRSFIERYGIMRILSQPTRIILRNIERRPLRALLSVVGIASACAILVAGLFWNDTFNYIVRAEYEVAIRGDITLSFVEPTQLSALHELDALPGVEYAEPFRSIPVRVSHGHRWRNTSVEGIPSGAYLRRVLDTRLRPIPIPDEGILLSRRLAELLSVVPGDEVSVELQEGSRRTRRVVVAGMAEQYLGMGAYMTLASANRLAGRGDVASGAYLMVDRQNTSSVITALRERPRVAGAMSQERAIASFMETSARTMLLFTFILSLFAGVIAFGVVYNSVRIALSERDRELASMRVLGFRRGEIAYILLGEMALLVLLAIPVGFVIGALLSNATVAALQSDMFHFPVILTRKTFGSAAAVVLGAALVSALLVRRRLDRLDLIGVLKTRE